MKAFLEKSAGGVFYDTIFALFIAVFIGVLLWSPKLAPTDDFIFLKTLQVGKPILYYSSAFPYYDAIDLGRFTPLAAMEYNFIGLFSGSPSPFWYFLYHALQAFVFSLLFVWLIRKYTFNYKVIYGATALLMLTPGFVITMLRLQLDERDLLFFLTVFLLLYLAYLKKQNWGLAIGILLTANIAIYYKETAFLAIGAFAFARLLLFWKKSDKKIKIVDSLLIISSLIYLVLYYFIVLRHSHLSYLGSAPIGILEYFKRFINYAFFTDALIYLVILPIFFIRLYEIFFRKNPPKPLMDPLIAGTLAYSLVYIIIGYGPYYLLPAYAFAIPAAIIYFREKVKINKLWVMSFIITALTIVLNVLPAGIHYLTFHKYLMRNFNDTINFLISDIKSNHGGERPDIYLYGTDRGPGRATYEILGDFLVYQGLTDKEFDLKSDVAAPAGPLYAGKVIPPFTIFQNPEAQTIKSGDYLIVVPQSKKLVTPGTIKELEKNYRLVFSAKSPYLFPSIDMKSLTKYLLIKKGVDNHTLIENENAFSSPDYYVFVKS